jgi:hypothetical protein
LRDGRRADAAFGPDDGDDPANRLASGAENRSPERTTSMVLTGAIT